MWIVLSALLFIVNFITLTSSICTPLHVDNVIMLDFFCKAEKCFVLQQHFWGMNLIRCWHKFHHALVQNNREIALFTFFDLSINNQSHFATKLALYGYINFLFSPLLSNNSKRIRPIQTIKLWNILN